MWFKTVDSRKDTVVKIKQFWVVVSSGQIRAKNEKKCDKQSIGNGSVVKIKQFWVVVRSRQKRTLTQLKNKKKCDKKIGKDTVLRIKQSGCPCSSNKDPNTSQE